MKELLATASGWEYDVLRLLSPDSAEKVWTRAWSQGETWLKERWWGRPLIVSVGCFYPVILVIIWNIAIAQGWGWLGSLTVEVLTHLLIAFPFALVLSRLITSFLRPFVQQELFLFIQNEPSPDHQELFLFIQNELSQKYSTLQK